MVRKLKVSTREVKTNSHATDSASSLLQEQKELNDCTETFSETEFPSLGGAQIFDNVSLWLEQCNLSEYIDVFKEAGYDDINLIKILNDSDLDAMKIDKPGSRRKILLYAQQLGTDNPLMIPRPITPPVISAAKSKAACRTNPYRCTKCCEYKIRSLDGKAHQCKPELVGHTWAECPTKNLRQHPEERARRKGEPKPRPPTKKSSTPSKKTSSEPEPRSWPLFPPQSIQNITNNQFNSFPSSLPLIPSLFDSASNDQSPSNTELTRFPFSVSEPPSKRAKLNSDEDDLSSNTIDIPYILPMTHIPTHHIMGGNFEAGATT